MAAGAALVTAAALELTFGLRVPGPRTRQPPLPPVWLGAPVLGGAVETAVVAGLCLLAHSLQRASHRGREAGSVGSSQQAWPQASHAGAERRGHRQ